MKRASWVAVGAVIVLMGCGEEAPPVGAPPPTSGSALGAGSGSGSGSGGGSGSGSESGDGSGSGTEAATATATEAATAPEAETSRPALRPGSEPEFEALACLGRHDYACVTRLYGEGRAQSARQLAMVIQAQRGAGDDLAACATMVSLFERFPESVETARYRAFHLRNCRH